MARKKRADTAAPTLPTPPVDTGEDLQDLTERSAAVMTDVPIEEVEDRVIEHAVEIDLTNEETAPAETELVRQTVTQRCAEAKEMGACGCRCRGKYHGREHPDGWKEEPGCDPLTPEERKVAKRETLKAWRHNHPDRVKAYMDNWRATSAAETAVKARAAAAKRAAAEGGSTPEAQ